jgi:hypothetical protein
MPYPDEPGDLVVSLQDRACDFNASRGHLALGALIGTNRAVFQLPEDFQVSPDAKLEVLVSPTAPDRDTIVERIQLDRLWVSSLAPAALPQAALAPLLHASRYGDNSTVDPAVFEAALVRSSDIWSALLDLGLVTRTLLDVDPTAVLEQIGRIEEVQRRLQVALVLSKEAKVINNCVFSSSCHPWKPTP